MPANDPAGYVKYGDPRSGIRIKKKQRIAGTGPIQNKFNIEVKAGGQRVTSNSETIRGRTNGTINRPVNAPRRPAPPVPVQGIRRTVGTPERRKQMELFRARMLQRRQNVQERRRKRIAARVPGGVYRAALERQLT